MCRSKSILLPALLLCAVSTASAKGYEVTPFLGYSLDAASASGMVPSYGLVFGFPLRDPGPIPMTKRCDGKHHHPTRLLFRCWILVSDE